MLSDTNVTLAYVAKDSLAKMGTSAVYDLIKILQDTAATSKMKNRAAWVLKDMGPKAAIALRTIIQILKDSTVDFDLRRNAIQICGSIGPDAKETVPELMKFLSESKFESYRETAAWALGKIGSDAKEAVPDLLQAMKKDWNEKVRIQAEYALGRIGEPAVNELLNLFSDTLENHFLRAKAVEILSYMGPNAKKALPTLIAVINDSIESQKIRFHAAEAIGEIGEDATVAIVPLIRLMGEKWGNDIASSAARTALVKIGRPAVPELIKLIIDGNDLSYPETRLRASAVFIIGEIQPPENSTVTLLIKVISDTTRIRDSLGTREFYDFYIREEAVKALGKFGVYSKEAIPALLNAFNYYLSNLKYDVGIALIKIAEDFQDKKDFSALPLLKMTYDSVLSVAARSSFMYPKWTEEELGRFRRAIQALSLIEEESRTNWLKNLYHESAAIRFILSLLAVYVILSFLSLTLLWLRPLWILKINERIKRTPPVNIRGMTIALQHLLVIGFFNYSRQVLDAWVKNHIAKIRKNVDEKCTGTAQTIPAEARVTFNDSQPKSFSVQDLKTLFSQKRICLLIWGDDESVKKIIVCQMAEAAMEEESNSRLCENHPMLPIFIEKGIFENSSNTEDPLVETGLHPLNWTV